jgi:hypothetical protein
MAWQLIEAPGRLARLRWLRFVGVAGMWVAAGSNLDQLSIAAETPIEALGRRSARCKHDRISPPLRLHTWGASLSTACLMPRAAPVLIEAAAAVDQAQRSPIFTRAEQGLQALDAHRKGGAA